MSDQTKILEKAEDKIIFTIENKLDPKEFFDTRDGLYVYSSFKDCILGKAELLEEDTKFSISSFKLLAYANDTKIEGELPERHIFSESEVCAVIAELISRQSKGEEGIMLTNGYANLFYTPSFVVLVSWHVSHWYVSAWRRRGLAWSAGRRVFSPATLEA